jgi:hypothetical protein
MLLSTLRQSDMEELLDLVDKLSNKLQSLLCYTSLKDDPEAQRLSKSVFLITHALRGTVNKITTASGFAPEPVPETKDTPHG